MERKGADGNWTERNVSEHNGTEVNGAEGLAFMNNERKRSEMDGEEVNLTEKKWTDSFSVEGIGLT